MAGDYEEHEVETLLGEGALLINDGYRAKNSELSDTGIPFARAGNIDGGFHFEDADRVPAHTLAKVGLKRSLPGDVVFTSKGTVGRFAFVREGTPKFVYSPQLCYWRSCDASRIHPRWLFYWMNGREFFLQFKGVAGQTDMAEYVSLRDQRAMKITLPPLAEQKAIAAVLGALDDKIELNRRMGATLEAMARALFQSWFGNFDPVRRNLDRRGPKSERGKVKSEIDSPPNLSNFNFHSSLFAPLFPDSFQDSELGPIPKGWSAKRLPEAIEVNPRRTLKAGTVAPYLDMKNLPTQGHSAEEVIDREFNSGTKFQNGDTLLARITPCLENGKTGYVDFLKDGEVGWGSTEYIVLAPKPPLPPQFGYLLARSDALRSHAIQNMTGTSGRQRVPSECFNTFWLAVPPPKIAHRFDELTTPMMAKIKANADQSRTLATLRDTLLPKLLSGELSVAEVEFQPESMP
ncbi:MAG: restriction endonuclease subunit S [Opitutaceae bacterium]|nr:restriction endonuclease subunit S [Opitutaceae bacterium]